MGCLYISPYTLPFLPKYLMTEPQTVYLATQISIQFYSNVLLKFNFLHDYSSLLKTLNTNETIVLYLMSLPVK